MFLVTTKAAECGRDGREFLVSDVRALGRIVMRQKDHSAESDQEYDKKSQDKFHARWRRLIQKVRAARNEIDVTSDSWRHHIFVAAKSPSKIRLKLTARDGPIVIPSERGTTRHFSPRERAPAAEGDESVPTPKTRAFRSQSKAVERAGRQDFA
jgi:hypothetical protein